MGRTFPRLEAAHRAFLEAQPVFFVATAPLSPAGHVNLSPKSGGSLRVLADDEVAYLDLTGSGNETSAHLLENGRVTLMACAFEGDPLVLRVYGRGDVHLPGSARWDDLRARFPPDAGAVRQVVTVKVGRVQTSCGHGVPLMDLRAHRTLLLKWAAAKGPEGAARYRAERNRLSIDGLPTHLAEDLARRARAPAPDGPPP